MAKLTKTQIAERDEAIAKLREMLPPGTVVSTILRHAARSGMTRCISPVYQDEDLSYWVARALGERIHRDHGGIIVSGCGMDMGFHLVYTLSRVLYPEGFGCIGRPDDAARRWSGACPSNDHSNGDRDYTPHAVDEAMRADGSTVVKISTVHWHKDGGYALLHRWL